MSLAAPVQVAMAGVSACQASPSGRAAPGTVLPAGRVTRVGQALRPGLCVRARGRGAVAAQSSSRYRDSSPEAAFRSSKSASGSATRVLDGSAEEFLEELDAVPAAEQKGFDLTGGAWSDLPARYQVVVATCLAFVICNMDKVNMSVAIIPMAREFGWSPSVAGIVQSSFFWGYILCQIPGGYFSSKLGGRKVLPTGVALWSGATAAVPALAGTIPTLCLSRAAVGLGEGVAPSAATDMVARVIPKGERSRAVSFIFGGLHVGSIIGLLAGPALINAFGWPAVFVAFGGVGLGWAAWWEALQADIKVREPEVAKALTEARKSANGVDADAPVPWRPFLRDPSVRALMYTHFCHNWFHYTVLAWLPSYFTDTLSVDLAAAAQISLLPPVAGIAVSAMAGPLADGLIGKGVKTATVRKSLQGAAFIGPIAFLVAAHLYGEGNAPLTVGLITAALGTSSFSLGGLYSNHQDISPKYASILLGLTNTAGAIPGIIGVAVVGFLLDQTGSWDLALFGPAIMFFLTGAAVYTHYGRSDEVDFDAGDDSPLAIERSIDELKAPLVKAWGDSKDDY